MAVLFDPADEYVCSVLDRAKVQGEISLADLESIVEAGIEAKGGNITTDDESARRFLAAVNTSTMPANAQRSASATPPTASASAAPASVTATAPAGHKASAAAQTFPLADPQPGQEPK